MDLSQLTDTQLASMPWDALISLRAQLKDPQAQARLAPFEHRAYAREQVQANPAMAPIFGLMAPGYQMAKMVAPQQGQTPPSLQQLKQGLMGTGEGFLSGIRGLMHI